MLPIWCTMADGTGNNFICLVFRVGGSVFRRYVTVWVVTGRINSGFLTIFLTSLMPCSVYAECSQFVVSCGNEFE